jgi:amino acid transporter
MSTTHKISLKSAILMNLNIMAGAGIFVNIVDLTGALGLFGGLLYLGVGLFMFPLIFTFAQLVKVYPSGGFYAFAKPISPFLAFMSTWTYFFGKLASASLLLHVATTFLQKLLPGILSGVSPVAIDLIILAIFMFLNSLNLRIGIIIQNCFFASKSIPLLLLIALGIYHFDINLLQDLEPASFSSFVVMLPLVLYCFSGFEAACSISRNIVDASKNAPKAIFYSFFSIISIYVIFQTVVAMMLLPQISAFGSYADALPYLACLMPVSSWVQAKCATAISFLIGFSAMGAAYGLLFSNAWNLYTLAEHGHTFGSKKLASLNQHSVPVYAVLTEGLICCLFLIMTGGAKIPLQQTATLGCTITYTISSIAFLMLAIGSRYTGLLSLLTCSGFIIACVMSAIKYNFTSLYLFGIMLAIGLLMYFCLSKKR